jgi:hypothetical protein
MPCRERPLVFKVLTGDLSPAKSTAMLEHFRRCGECREAFEFGAKTIRQTGVVGVVTPPPAASGDEAPVSLRLPSSPAMRRNRRTLIVFGVAIAALMMAGVGRGRGDADKNAEPVAEAVWRRALADGTPVVRAPLGTADARPRVIMALVPVGSVSARIFVIDDAGRVVLEREVKSGSEGCFVEETGIDAPGGAFRAGRLLVPFPDETALPLVPGRGYGVVVAVAGGHSSASAAFQVRPGAGPLHDAPPEAR